MTQPTGLFNEEQPGNDGSATSQPSNQDAPLVLDKNGIGADVFDLVGEGLKYSTIEAALSSVPAAQSHIATIEAENTALRAAAEKNDRLQELIDTLSASTSVSSEDPANTNDTETQTLTPEDLSRLIDKELEQRDTTKTKEQNLQQVSDYMAKEHGDLATANSALKKRAKDLGVSMDFLQNLGATSPAAFQALVGVREATDEFSTGDRSSTNTMAVTQDTNGNDRTDKFYKNLLRTDPKRYYSRETQAQMMQDAGRLGEKFFK